MKPLALSYSGNIGNVYLKHNKTLYPTIEFFPTGFTIADIDKRVSVSLGEKELYTYTPTHPQAGEMDLFCSWVDRSIVGNDNKIDNDLQLGAECISKMKQNNHANIIANVDLTDVLKTEVELLKQNMDLRDKAGNLDKFQISSDDAKAALISDQEQCKNFSKVADIQAVIAKISVEWLILISSQV